MTTFKFKNQYTVNVHTHKPLPADDQQTTLVFLTAIGVPLRKYSKLFAELTAKGYSVIAADYPCCGENTPQVNRSVDYNYQDIVDDFIPQLLALSEHDKTYLFGHSLGGHMATIYSVLHDVPVIGVATGNLHYKNWSGAGKLNILRAVAVFKPMIALYGYFPGYKIKFGDRETKGMMTDWCHTALTGRYDFIQADLQASKQAGKGQGIYFYIEGDDYAPYKSTQNLAKLCADSTLISVKLPEHIKGNPHGAWIKDPDIIVQHLDEQLRKRD
jgi:predicted alpha/beta hydrolase